MEDLSRQHKTRHDIAMNLTHAPRVPVGHASRVEPSDSGLRLVLPPNPPRVCQNPKTLSSVYYTRSHPTLPKSTNQTSYHRTGSTILMRKLHDSQTAKYT